MHRARYGALFPHSNHYFNHFERGYRQHPIKALTLREIFASPELDLDQLPQQTHIQRHLLSCESRRRPCQALCQLLQLDNRAHVQARTRAHSHAPKTSLDSLPHQENRLLGLNLLLAKRRHKDKGHPASHTTTGLGHKNESHPTGHTATGLRHASSDHNSFTNTLVLLGLLLVTIKGGTRGLLRGDFTTTRLHCSGLTSLLILALVSIILRDLGLTPSLD